MHNIKAKTSIDSPLNIAELEISQTGGRLGLTLCPGKKDLPYRWDRDLTMDMQVIRAWGASTVITLIEDHEFSLLAVSNLGNQVDAMGMAWLHLPIRDVDIPDHRFELGWKAAGPLLHQQLDAGERILIHCRGGMGRTGLVAGRILVERGMAPHDAIREVRAARPRAIETRAQEQYVLDTNSVKKNNVINRSLGEPDCHQ